METKDPKAAFDDLLEEDDDDLFGDMGDYDDLTDDQKLNLLHEFKELIKEAVAKVVYILVPCMLELDEHATLLEFFCLLSHPGGDGEDCRI